MTMVDKALKMDVIRILRATRIALTIAVDPVVMG
jgi:hypothetical protein